MRVAIIFVVLALVVFTGRAVGQSPSTADMQRAMAELQASHIAANVPPHAKFMQLLQRDIQAYFAAVRLPLESVQIELLRQSATQSDVSYPKYYLWIRAIDRGKRHVEGVMRVVAIERVRFEVTDFTPTAAIRSNSASLASIYPALLIPAIKQRAGKQ